jgi:DNA replication protein DnaC
MILPNNSLSWPKKDEKMSMTQVRQLMQSLKLHGMAGSLEKAIEDARKDEWTMEEMVDVLLQAEADFRERRRTQSRIKASKLKPSAAFEDYDFTAKRSLTKAQLKEIYSLSWLTEGRPLILIGQTGVGKSFLGQATGLHACQNGKSALFISVSHWMEQQALARNTGTYLKFREKMIRPDLLILDDFGMRKFTAMEAEDLREICEERSFGKSTMVTTQLPLKHWAEVIPDPVLAEAITDRFEGPGLVITITGDSYRPRKAQLAAQAKTG